MEIPDHEIWDNLVPNRDLEINNGLGYFIKENVSQRIIKKMREYHENCLKRGEPYFILDFLVEDIKKGIKIERVPTFGFRRKSSKDSD